MSGNFAELRKQAEQEWKDLQSSAVPTLLVGAATCGASAGATEVLETLREEIEKRSLECNLIEVGCIGLCYVEPIVCIQKPGQPGIAFGGVTTKRAVLLLDKVLEGDEAPPKFALGTLGEGTVEGLLPLAETPVLKPQVRRVLAKCGLIDPTNLNHYLAMGGYEGLEKALKMEPQAVIDAVKASGLRGRGGAGFPAWRKWQFCRDAPGDLKYLVCNADEGDPGAFMNRSLLESDPHALLEGMIISGYALGASKAYIYCRAEYPLALERLDTALAQARENGLLGKNILASGFDFEIKVKEGAGAFVCGEETALIASIEGQRGMPRPRPPFPAVSGLWGKPTIINNVETLACVALVLQKGASWFAEVGTEKSKGTKTFALVGKVKNTGLVEVPLGITLREMIFDIGGGILKDKPFKAVQTGGPSGGCIPAELLDTRVDYDSLGKVGSIMGSGGMVVMDEETCMVDVARYFLDFTEKESCGECVPCRLGTKQMLQVLQDITAGNATEGDAELLEVLGKGIVDGSLCGLGQTAPNPVLTTLGYFPEEYDEHIRNGFCPAGTCTALFRLEIDAEKCNGCHLCLRICPSEAVIGEKKKPHVIIEEKCINCGSCREVCRHDAVTVHRLKACAEA
ncbi:MAG: NADH-ubiquinone oxidoreductase-F iron-sulfur binding region domain-containing protein [Planctomycetota bacterium]|jgi:NADH-quinone oxidoreductase subunit F